MSPRLGFTSLKRKPGFTLAELLIALAILGVIATFTIPKILTIQQNSGYNAAAHDVAAMASVAFQQAKLAGTVTSTTKFADLTQYMNYIAVDTTSTVQNIPGWPSYGCGGSVDCLKLHNGGILYWFGGESFGGTQTTNAVRFYYDPDASKSSVNAQAFYVLYSGKVTDSASGNGLVSSGGTFSTYSMAPWFSW